MRLDSHYNVNIKELLRIYPFFLKMGLCIFLELSNLKQQGYWLKMARVFLQGSPWSDLTKEVQRGPHLWSS